MSISNFDGNRLLCEENEKSICPWPTSETKPDKQTKVIIILGTVKSAIIVLLTVAVMGLLVYKCRPGHAGYQRLNVN